MPNRACILGCQGISVITNSYASLAKSHDMDMRPSMVNTSDDNREEYCSPDLDIISELPITGRRCLP